MLNYMLKLEVAIIYNLYVICIAIDDFTQTATVIPLPGNTFQGSLLANNANVRYGDRLFFDKYGMFKKVKHIHNKKNIICNAIGQNFLQFERQVWIILREG
ncbi:hypothetical protein F9Y90_04735 (plasmid) [Borrelia miyamotoi]|uniref:DUF228 domain-containing protein n=1 Tax=Borrelia miyamotoi TaxID=47466 RepID=A0A5P8AUN7_9SPIR|nr:DUF228 domain-containing protein [Borrelia miyamotoi]QFP42424.1 hypothetical protein F9Y90_04735 [Borrelia miyamotoi]WAZ72429.1 DUF228 domain-containing protein [Borrelia miyamotoi]WVI05349.1 DUF228 domain-containing protein [Borrelia miyamotoi]